METSFANLSNDLLADVFAYLRKPDLRSVRLVCRSFERAGVPRLFDQIHLSFDPLGLDVAESVINTFGRYVTTIKVTVLYYGDLSLDDFKAACKS